MKINRVIGNRIIVEEDKIDEFCEFIKLNIIQQLEKDIRFAIYDFDVDVIPEFECFNIDTHHCWHEINIIIKNTFFNSFTCLTFSTNDYSVSPIIVNDDIIFTYVFECGSESITDIVTFENNDKNGRFEDVIFEYINGLQM